MNMLTIGAIAFCVSLLIAGVWYVLNGYRTPEEEGPAVPISHEEIKKIRTSGDVTVQAKKETGVSKTDLSLPKPSPATEDLTVRIEQLKKDNDHLRGALEKEIALQTTQSSAELDNLRNELAGSRASLEKITVELQDTQRSLEELTAKMNGAEADKALLEEKINALQAPDPELERLSKECERLTGSESAERLLRVQLTAEKDRLLLEWQNKEKSYEEKIASLKQMIADWENNSRSKRSQDDQWKAALEQKGSEWTKVLAEKERIIDGLRAEIDTLKKKTMELNDTPVVAAQPSLTDDELSVKIKQLEELNAFLTEKERRLQYELIKNRAHTLGLEHICEDLKQKLEGPVCKN